MFQAHLQKSISNNLKEFLFNLDDDKFPETVSRKNWSFFQKFCRYCQKQKYAVTC